MKFLLTCCTIAALGLSPMVRAVDFDEQALTLTAGNRMGRNALATNGLFFELAKNGFQVPKEGDRVDWGNDRTSDWSLASFTDGTLEVKRSGERRRRSGGYVWLTAQATEPQVCLLDASGHANVCVNGAWRTGDVYNNNSLPIPVVLKKGTNHFLFERGRGPSLQAELTEPEAQVYFSSVDATLPDLIDGDASPQWAALMVVNASQERLDDLVVKTFISGHEDASMVVTSIGTILPLTFRKVPFQIRPLKTHIGFPFQIELQRREGDTVMASTESKPVTKQAFQTRRVTFVSEIDGSVQYYGLTQAATDEAGNERPGLVLSLHGASVEAKHQASCYQPKSWVHVVAPTNRRRFGFDWEDWGRWDALEAYEHAESLLNPDPSRRYLTGHSMGGHGTWQLGAHFPDRWAAIGPSAGWVSFQSYASARRVGTTEEPSELEKMFTRSASASDTLALLPNYKQLGVYVLHGDADDNVPVSEARTMRRELATFHPDFAYFEQPGAGHWWGNQCLDWPRMFDFFRDHQRSPSDEIRSIEFHTASPGVSANCHWIRVEAQEVPLETSWVEIEFDPNTRQFTGTTSNVTRLSIDIAHIDPGTPLAATLDGSVLERLNSPAGTHRVWFEKDAKQGWEIGSLPELAQKGPHRMGPFKEAFRNRMLLVIGTQGSAEATAWAMNKARFDAETFWYRGNGSIDIVLDSEFESVKGKDRNVIIYGNSDTNGVWNSLLGESPIQVQQGKVTFGDETISGDDLTCLFLYPRPDSSQCSVGVVAGTGMTGARTTDRLPYFVSGVGYPDYCVMKVDVLNEGSRGVVKAGFFNNDWQL